MELGRILWSRIDYPYDLHWIDGGTLLHAHRLLNGQAIYPALTENAGFLANPYPPVLYILLAVAGATFGLDYATGRVVAIAATALSASVLAREVYLRFRGFPMPWVWALLTLGGIAAGFPNPPALRSALRSGAGSDRGGFGARILHERANAG